MRILIVCGIHVRTLQLQLILHKNVHRIWTTVTGNGFRFYRKTIEIDFCEYSHNLMSIHFQHFDAIKSGKIYRNIFQDIKSFDGYDEPGRVTIVDKENTIFTT